MVPLRRIFGRVRKFLPGTKCSRVLVFLTALAVTVSGSLSMAIRFQSEEGGGYRRTLYPEAVKNVVQRTDELKVLASQSHLGALFPYLELTDFVKGRQAQWGAAVGSPFLNFLNQSADLIVAQSPQGLQLSLRKMYFAGESVRVTDDVWRQSNGGRHVRGLLLSGNEISVEIVAGLENSPGLQKLHRLIAMIEIGQAYTAREVNQGSDYRLYFPVLDMLNKIVTALFVDEVIKKMGNETIRQELAKAEMAETVKASLENDFLGRGYMHSKSISWTMENTELRGPQLVEWVRDLRALRDQRARLIKGLSSYHEKVEVLVRLDLVSQPRDRYFQLARAARNSGDDKTFRIASELMTSQGNGSNSGGSPPPAGASALNGPSCERSFVPTRPTAGPNG